MKSLQLLDLERAWDQREELLARVARDLVKAMEHAEAAEELTETNLRLVEACLDEAEKTWLRLTQSRGDCPESQALEVEMFDYERHRNQLRDELAAVRTHKAAILAQAQKLARPQAAPKCGSSGAVFYFS